MATNGISITIDLGELLTTHRMRKRRTAARKGDWTQRYVAARCGVDEATYRAWEKGERVPSEAMAIGLARILDIPDVLIEAAIQEAIRPSSWNGVNAGRELSGVAA